MPHLNAFSWAVWIAAILFQPALAAYMVRGGAWRRWTSLFAFLVIKSTTSFLLLFIYLLIRDQDLRAAAYFYAYWLGTFLAQVAQVWMIVQIGCELGGISKKVRGWIRLGIATLALADLCLCIGLSLKTPMPLYGRISHVILGTERAVSLAWLATFLGACVAAEFLGIQWARGVREISIGFAIEAVGATGISWAAPVFSNVTLLSDARGAVYIFALLAWGIGLSKNKKIPDLLPGTAGRVKSALRSYVVAIERN